MIQIWLKTMLNVEISTATVNLAKHKEQIIKQNKRLLRVAWLRISLLLQDVVKAKADPERTPKSLKASISYTNTTILSCSQYEEHEATPTAQTGRTRG